MAEEELRFDKPPVNEIVFQVAFPEIRGFGAPHAGLFWSDLRDTFPAIEAAPRLGLPEAFNIRSGVLPDNRIWLIHKDKSQVIQIQDDRFIFNWRKTGESDAYPGFDALYPVFISLFGRFSKFLDAENLCPDKLTGFELQYVNHIYQGVWNDWHEIGKIFPSFDWSGNPKKMPPLKGFRHFSACDLPDDLGELAITIDSRTHKPSESPLISFEIKVTASKKEIDLTCLDESFLPAHDRLVETLVSMTSSAVQQSWKKV